MASTIQAGTGLLRLASTKFTGGFGNDFFSTFENSVAVFYTSYSLVTYFGGFSWGFTFCFSVK
nr:DUF4126 domain-containing protein [uncultured Emticicia sp.]